MIVPECVFIWGKIHDEVTEFTIVNMLHYSLEHADKNLPHKRQIAKKPLLVCISFHHSCHCHHLNLHTTLVYSTPPYIKSSCLCPPIRSSC
uniref:Uncharacterized protein n=1 Tax=Salix viminalis TaxID=40686 RepID=A0A6N2LFZ6_SALVM